MTANWAHRRRSWDFQTRCAHTSAAPRARWHVSQLVAMRRTNQPCHAGACIAGDWWGDVGAAVEAGTAVVAAPAHHQGWGKRWATANSLVERAVRMLEQGQHTLACVFISSCMDQRRGSDDREIQC